MGKSITYSAIAEEMDFIQDLGELDQALLKKAMNAAVSA